MKELYRRGKVKIYNKLWKILKAPLKIDHKRMRTCFPHKVFYGKGEELKKRTKIGRNIYQHMHSS